MRLNVKNFFTKGSLIIRIDQVYARNKKQAIQETAPNPRNRIQGIIKMEPKDGKTRYLKGNFTYGQKLVSESTKIAGSDPDPLVRGMDPRIRITIPDSHHNVQIRIRNTGIHIYC
jgi:hypothetical protein